MRILNLDILQALCIMDIKLKSGNYTSEIRTCVAKYNFTCIINCDMQWWLILLPMILVGSYEKQCRNKSGYKPGRA